MRLIVKKDDRKVGEFQFATGPIHLGRGTNSQVFLADRRVSRQHAVIFATPDGNWVLQDLDSANKTFLNDEPIHKAKLKTGDRIVIADFTIEVTLETGAEPDRSAPLEDTLITAPREAQSIVRNVDAEHAPDIRFPAVRAKHFLQATEEICSAGGLDHVLQTLTMIMFRQFDAYRVWCALRNEPSGPMTAHVGKTLDGETLSLNDVQIKDQITYAVDKGQFLLLPSLSSQGRSATLNSAMVAPVLDPTGCFGVIYLDNTPKNRPYDLGDLDYLMLLAISTAAIVENF